MNHPTRRNVMTGALALAAVSAAPEVAHAKPPSPDAPRRPEGLRRNAAIDRTRFLDEFPRFDR